MKTQSFSKPLEVSDGAMRLVLPMPPTANLYWRLVGGRLVISAEARAYKKLVDSAVRGAGYRRLEGPVKVSMDVFRQRKSGDLDNRQKCVLDALQGHLYGNDSQIVEIHARRFEDKANPRVEIVVSSASGESAPVG